MKVSIKPSFLRGEITPPPSKSMLHRAIICASLACGISHIENVIYSEDVKATIAAFESLGVEITKNPNDLLIKSSGKLSFAENLLINCNESGSTLRFLIPIVTQKQTTVSLTGQKSLFSRPLSVYEKIYEKAGILFKLETDRLTIKGDLKPGKFHIPGNISSQFITGLLFALPTLNNDSIIIIEGELESKNYVKMTIDTLEKFGIKIFVEENTFVIPGNQKYHPHDIKIESDFSQMAFFAVAGIINGDIKCQNMNFSSLQADRSIIDIIKKINGDITEDKSCYRFKKSSTIGTTVDVSQFPDLAPVLSILLALSSGESKITNAKRLILKESNRLKTTHEVLKLFGVESQMCEDSLVIQGIEKFKGGIIDSYNDHRIAMMIAVASTRAEGEVIIVNAEAINKSYPGFFKDLEKLGADISYL